MIITLFLVACKKESDDPVNQPVNNCENINVETLAASEIANASVILHGKLSHCAIQDSILVGFYLSRNDAPFVDYDSAFMKLTYDSLFSIDFNDLDPNST